jgi:RNA polymerase sigma factor (TIGR02999 family)
MDVAPGESTDNDLTGLIRAAGSGDAGALQDLFAAVYADLKRLAHRQLVALPNATINTTGLVHETYLKLVRPQGLRLNERGHFFAMAAKAMRQIVVDHARRRLAQKRGGEAQAVTLDERMSADAHDADELVHLDGALDQLQRLEPRLAELVELRFFAGLSVEQIAELRDVATRTVIRDWRRARAWLFDSMPSTAAR